MLERYDFILLLMMITITTCFNTKKIYVPPLLPKGNATSIGLSRYSEEQFEIAMNGTHIPTSVMRLWSRHLSPDHASKPY